MNAIETPHRKAAGESESVKEFFVVLLAYPAAELTGKRIPVNRDEFDGLIHWINDNQKSGNIVDLAKRTDVVNALAGIQYENSI